MNKSLGIYIHIPFCVRRCDYCGFLSIAGADCGTKSSYVESLIKEIHLSKNEMDISNFNVDSIFFGGGTPSLLDSREIKRILNEIEKIFGSSLNKEKVEITLEANPESLTQDKLKDYKEMGINRLSLGLQSTNDNLLKILGRVHDLDAFQKSYIAAREEDFLNINIDAMFGLPGQTIKMLEETVNYLVSLAPEHISLYSLQIEENTPFYDKYKNNILDIPSYDQDRQMYHLAEKKLKDAGYEHYEISNFAKPEYICKHNDKYWDMKDFIGFGLGASSYFNKIRYKNTSDLQDYINKIAKGSLPILNKDAMEEESTSDAMSIFMFTGLRRAYGVSYKDFEGLFNKDIKSVYKDIWEKILEYKRDGFIEIDDIGIRLTEKGIDISNVIMSEFII